MNIGNIVEYIDRQRVVCAVITEVKHQRLRVLTETNREVNLAAGRLLHVAAAAPDPTEGRDRTVARLKAVGRRRQDLSACVNVKELWEVLTTEQEWVDLATMTAFCFPDEPGADQEAAVIRAFFRNRRYFKFDHNRFFPYTVEQVARNEAQEREQARRERIIREGAERLKRLLDGGPAGSPAEMAQFGALLKDYFLFERDSVYASVARPIVEKAGLRSIDGLFPVLVGLDVIDEDANLDLLRLEIPTAFEPAAQAEADALVADPPVLTAGTARKDLTDLPLITVDGQSTRDYDDALSLEIHPDHYRLGIHIIDVGAVVARDSQVDREARARGSSIYMPDRKIPMLPACLAEDLCSLKAGCDRPAVSTLVRIAPSLDILDWEIVPSVIRVRDQLSYQDANQMIEERTDLALLRDIAHRFRQRRLDDGAVQITLPEVNVWLDGNGEVVVHRINRESPARMLVAELMIMANWLAARLLRDTGTPAVFRSQPGPKERLFKGDAGTLFQNWMQRRLLNRFVLSYTPEAHSGLGLDAYVTGTSPIRKYFDLVTQRQLRAVFGLEPAYTAEEIDRTIQLLEQPMGNVSRVQRQRQRYWLFKHLEGCTGQEEEAVVLQRRRNGYQVLLPGYMLECDLPVSNGVILKPEDLVTVTLQHVSARRDRIAVFMS